MRPTLQKTLRAVLPLWRRLDAPLYALWCAWFTLASARLFYGYMMKQTGGEWSAPLDDVYIHFDYARATAQGHPFEWVAGNGYSSGNTSITYPFALALGWLLGFRAQQLMMWAALIAAACVFGVLLACRPLFSVAPGDRFGKIASYLLPPAFLGIGALNWSLWSGMEVAFFLGTWALALRAFFALGVAAPEARTRPGWWLGACGALMVLTRPEATTTIAAFGIAAAWRLRKELGTRGAAFTLARIGAPSVAVLVVQSIANRVLTGEWSANGAIVKLAMNSPFLTPDEKLADYIFNLKYVVLRNVEYHFTDVPAFGVLIPALAFAAIAVPRTRRVALLITAQIVGWMLIVSLNGQVRWQNERYTMPAVAWLLILAALGATALVRRAGRPNVGVVLVLGALAAQAIGVATRPPNTDPTLRVPWLLALGGGAVLAGVLLLWPARIAFVAAALVLAGVHQESKMRDQKWFFGRASRNIRDQHVTAGRWLAEQKPHRVLVGDAGALIYASERLGLDIIGLGGYRDLPFARAGVHGLPATLELMEHIPAGERPDLLAVYPSWWGVLPMWFTSGELIRFPAEGNVICGGYEDVIYRADWHLLGTGELLRQMPPGDAHVVDVVDVADLVSEREHGYRFPSPAGGWTDMKILADPLDGTRDMFDGGRRIASGKSERFTVTRLTLGRAAHLVVRSAPDGKARVRVRVAGADVDLLDFAPVDAWVERVAEIPAAIVTGSIEIEMANDGPNDFIDYHAWVTQ